MDDDYILMHGGTEEDMAKLQSMRKTQGTNPRKTTKKTKQK